MFVDNNNLAYLSPVSASNKDQDGAWLDACSQVALVLGEGVLAMSQFVWPFLGGERFWSSVDTDGSGATILVSTNLLGDGFGCLGLLGYLLLGLEHTL